MNEDKIMNWRRKIQSGMNSKEACCAALRQFRLRHRTTVRLSRQTQPFFYHGSNFVDLGRSKCAQWSQKFGRWNGQHALHIENTGFKEVDDKPDFKLRAPWLGGVGNDLDQRVILVRKRHADQEHRTHLCGEAQIGRPDPAALRMAHGVFGPDPLDQMLPPPPKLGPPPSKVRKHHRGECPACALGIVVAAQRPPPAIPDCQLRQGRLNFAHRTHGERLFRNSSGGKPASPSATPRLSRKE
jgi:hypothetical protein